MSCVHEHLWCSEEELAFSNPGADRQGVMRNSHCGRAATDQLLESGILPCADTYQQGFTCASKTLCCATQDKDPKSLYDKLLARTHAKLTDSNSAVQHLHSCT